MKNVILTAVSAILLLISCDDGKVGGYDKEPLPENFSYEILEDKSNEGLEKNQLNVELNQKLTEGQIATLAEKLFDSKPKQRRFYIFYHLSKNEYPSNTWATSHFDPELEIKIFGSTTQEDDNKDKISREEVKGEVIGKWIEDQYTSSTYIIYRDDNTIYLKTIYKNGQVSEEKLIEEELESGTRYNYMNGGYNGEYFVLNDDGNLEFYSSDDNNFTTADKL